MNEFTKLMVRGIAESTLSDMTAFVVEHANETGNFVKAVDGIIILPDEKKADVRVEIVEPEDEAAYLKISFHNKKGWEISCKGELEDSEEIVDRTAGVISDFYASGHLKTTRQKSTVRCV